MNFETFHILKILLQRFLKLIAAALICLTIGNLFIRLTFLYYGWIEIPLPYWFAQIMYGLLGWGIIIVMLWIGVIVVDSFRRAWDSAREQCIEQGKVRRYNRTER